MWTEIVNEDVAALHVGDGIALTPIADDVTERELRATQNHIEHRRATKKLREEFEELNEDLKQNRELRKQLIEKGYDPETIPV